MPRILVADDNSNIQKMVALAFKDDGIEVVSVGNGDAAIRKIPVIAPDLILADVFMPVRNGYEVCEFVKLDPRYMHVPVVLLVGAFDPLDEREVQRVHADGVLKKPFVPPDPLISIVKGLLAKSAGERLVATTVPAAVSSTIAEMTHAPAPAPVAAVPALVEDVNAWDTDRAFVTTAVASAPEERAKFSEPNYSASTTAAESEELADPSLTVTASRHPSLGEPAFWKRPAPAATEPDVVVEEVTEDHTWGRGSRLEESREGFAADDLPAIEPIVDPTEAAAQARGQAEPRAVLESIESDLSNPLVSAAAHPAEPERAPASASQPAESPVPDLGVLEVSAPAESLSADDAEQDSQGSGADPIAFPASLVMPQFAATEPSEAEETPLWPPEPLPAIIEFSPTSRQAEPALADAPVAEPPFLAPAADEPVSAQQSAFQPIVTSSTAGSDSSLPAPDLPAPEPEIVAAVHRTIVESGIPSQSSSEGDFAAVPEADFDEDLASAPGHGSGRAFDADSAWPPVFHPVFSSQMPGSGDARPETPSNEAAPASAAEPHPEPEAGQSTAPAPENSELIDALVTKIIQRMQPQIMDIVTREILRPVVESLVRREIEKP